jgi:hypothetical protein
MKRVAFSLIVAVISCLTVSAVLAQDYRPVPAMPQMPPQAVPGGMPMPPFGMSRAPVPCPPLPCAPLPPPPLACGQPTQCVPSIPCAPIGKPFSVAGMVGWQVNSDLGHLRIGGRTGTVFNLATQRLDLEVDGLWVGASARMDLAGPMAFRAEYRHLFPSEKTLKTGTLGRIPNSHSRSFSKSQWGWDVVDGSLSFGVACGVSAVGGFRWDHFSVSMSHAPLLPAFSSQTDQGDVTINSYQPYGGVEFAFTGCDSGILIRAIGSPWVSSSIDYGMTFGQGNTLQLPWIRDRIQVDSKWSSFTEVSIAVGKKINCDLTVGAFGMANVLWAYGDSKLTSHTNDFLIPGEVAPIAVPGQTESGQFDVDLNRKSFILGGNVAVKLPSPL